jgi:nucleoside-diphosphate-sugar epimerase
MKALVIGGSGPTGPHVVEGLRARGYRVTVLNRGVHRIPLPDDVEHIVGDPHFVEPLRSALDNRSFDLVIASYGRLAVTAEVLAGRAGRFIGVGGVPAYRGFFEASENWPTGNLLPIREDAPVAKPGHHKFEVLIAAAEEATLRFHPTGTVFRYPYVYGPRQVVPREWSVVRRVLDGRRTMVLIHGGLALMTHIFCENAAHAILLSVDNPTNASGKIYNCGDDDQLDTRQFIEVAAAALDVKMEIISIPNIPSAYGATVSYLADHKLLDTSLIRSDLGYRDLVPSVEALTRTVRWYRDNPLETGSEYEQRMHDVFDYEAEDKMIALYRTFEASIASVKLRPTNANYTLHPYAHPKKSVVGRDERGR